MEETSDSSSSRYLPIEDYAVIGDCHTAALISSKGSIDWYCPERFDAPAIFCKILDCQKGGFFQLTPESECKISRQYLASTNILESLWETDSGKVFVNHFMPIYQRGKLHEGYDVGHRNRIIIKLRGLSGRILPDYK